MLQNCKYKCKKSQFIHTLTLKKFENSPESWFSLYYQGTVCTADARSVCDS